jgi:hypothetical protein
MERGLEKAKTFNWEVQCWEEEEEEEDSNLIIPPCPPRS